MSTFNSHNSFKVAEETTLSLFSSKNLMFLTQTMTNNSVKELSVRNGMPMIIVISSRMIFRKLLCHSFHVVCSCFGDYSSEILFIHLIWADDKHTQRGLAFVSANYFKTSSTCYRTAFKSAHINQLCTLTAHCGCTLEVRGAVTKLL